MEPVRTRILMKFRYKHAHSPKQRNAPDPYFQHRTQNHKVTHTNSEQWFVSTHSAMAYKCKQVVNNSQSDRQGQTDIQAHRQTERQKTQAQTQRQTSDRQNERQAGRREPKEGVAIV